MTWSSAFSTVPWILLSWIALYFLLTTSRHTIESYVKMENTAVVFIPRITLVERLHFLTNIFLQAWKVVQAFSTLSSIFNLEFNLGSRISPRCFTLQESDNLCPYLNEIQLQLVSKSYPTTLSPIYGIWLTLCHTALNRYRLMVTDELLEGLVYFI